MSFMQRTNILSREYHKGLALICLNNAIDMRKTFEPYPYVPAHRHQAAKTKAVNYWLSRADSHIKIALRQRPVINDCVVNGKDVGAIYAN